MKNMIIILSTYIYSKKKVGGEAPCINTSVFFPFLFGILFSNDLMMSDPKLTRNAAYEPSIKLGQLLEENGPNSTAKCD